MNQATFFFSDQLNDFLPEERRGQDFVYCFKGNPSIKHLIEAMRTPHTEIGKILVNDHCVDFSYIVKNGDRVEVYPAESFRFGGHKTSLQGNGSERPRFLLDNHLGKLATYLRLLGFDVLYRNDYQDEELVEEALKDQRILLTRDRGLLMRRLIQNGYCIRALNPKQQLTEVLRRFNLFDEIQPFRRCLRCNSELKPIRKETILHRLEPLTRKYYNEFHWCENCDQIYWKGSHYERMEKLVETLKEHG